MLWLLGTALGAYAAVCALAFVFQDRLVWFPGPPPGVTPAALGLEYREAQITTGDGVGLHGWYLPGGATAVLISHGNAGTIAERLALIAALREMGHAVLAYDYRGYGRSEGAPSEEGTYRDAEAAFDWLVAAGHRADRIALYGESMGGAVALALATRRATGPVVLENTFSSLPAVGQRAYPFLPVRWLARIRYDSLARAPEVAVPVMVIHSPGDEIVPIAQGRALFEALAGEKTFLETEGGHNDGGFLQRAEWRAAVAAFLDR